MKKRGVLSLALTVLYTVMMVFPAPALSSYQVDLDLRSLTINETLPCFQDNIMCTTQINITVSVNYDQLNAEVFQFDHNMSNFNFERCRPFPIGGQFIPLEFIIPSSTLSAGQQIEFRIEVQDTRTDTVQAVPVFDEIGTIMVEIPLPDTPSAQFENYQNHTGGSAILELGWRVICTTGTCGSTCSGTTNCIRFPRACSTTGTPINCGDMPCQNGGTCSNTTAAPGGYTCDCPQAYEGEDCEIVDSCSSSPCENRGTCNQVPASTDYTCECTPMYTGTTCTDLVSTPTQNPATTDNNGDTSTSATTKDSAESYHASNSYWILIPLLVFLAQQLF